MNKNFFLLVVFFLALFAGCNTPTRTSIPVENITTANFVESAASSSPTLSTAQHSPTPTSTARPSQTPNPISLATEGADAPLTYGGTAFPQSNEIITPDNANHLVKLAQWGYGRIIDIAYSSDGSSLFVQTAIGGVVFDSTNLDNPIEVFYQPVEREKLLFDVFENNELSFSEIQAYEITTPQRLFPYNGFPDLGCDESYPFTPHLRDAEVVQAQYSPSEQNFFVTYRFDDESLPKLLYVYQSSDGNLIYTVEEETSILKATYSPDGKTLAVARWDGVIKIISAETGKELSSSYVFQEPVSELTFDLENVQLLVENSNTLNFYNLQNGLRNDFVDLARQGTYALFPETKTLVIGDEQGQILFLDASNREFLSMSRLHDDSITGLAASSAYQVLASSAADCSIKLWDENGNLIRKLEDLILPGETVENTREKIYTLTFTPSGQYLVGQNYDNWLAIWETNTGKIIQKFRPENPFLGPRRFYTISPDGNTLVISGTDPEIQFVDLQTLQVIQILEVPFTEDYVSQIIFSPDGQILVATTTSGWMYLWNVSDQNLLLAKRVHVERIDSLTFSQDGRLIATGGFDGTISIWGISP